MQNPSKDGLIQPLMPENARKHVCLVEETRQILIEIRDQLRGQARPEAVTLMLDGKAFADAVGEAFQRNRRVIGTILGDA